MLVSQVLNKDRPPLSAGTTATLDPEDVATSAPPRILLADDDAAARELVQRALASEGHQVVSTQDGAEALEKLQAGPASFDLLISDVQMPGVDGIELITKAVALAPNLRVILMSGFADELDRAAHLKTLIACEISKPFTLEQVRSVVRGVLG